MNRKNSNNIIPLPDKLVAKIAAGEVVERPASAVKELLENSLDAGARNIKIEIYKAGLKQISVTDDGFGMDKKNLLQCFLPHTTSKIQAEEDLENICSLGFRGEALSSIASVSRLTIQSRLKNQNIGNLIKIEQEKIIETSPVGMPQGTIITIDSLFQNTPARKNFLSKPQTEFQHILSLTIRFALAFPKIGFSLFHNNKNILNLPQNQNLGERVFSILGNQCCEHLIPIKLNNSELQLHGFISTPQIASRSKNKQFLFINNRPIKNTAISMAIKNAYGSLLDAKSQPLFLLYLQISPYDIDVNIHPRKEEIKFFNQNYIIASIVETVKNSLTDHNLTYKFTNFEKAFEDDADEQINDLIARDCEAFEETHSAQILRESTPFWKVRSKIKDKQILQIDNTYLIAETENGFLLVDQHAAHERILYEQLVETFKKSKNKKIYLKKSLILHLPPEQSQLLQDNLSDFAKIGFEIELFGNHTFKITAIPQIFKKRQIELLISEVLEDICNKSNNAGSKNFDLQSQRTITYLSCKNAIKAGEFLNEEERKKLIDKLQKTKNQFTCPHGRPTQIEVSIDELEKMFRRK